MIQQAKARESRLKPYCPRLGGYRCFCMSHSGTLGYQTSHPSIVCQMSNIYDPQHMYIPPATHLPHRRQTYRQHAKLANSPSGVCLITHLLQRTQYSSNLSSTSVYGLTLIYIYVGHAWIHLFPSLLTGRD